MWLKELNPFPLQKKTDSKNLTFFQCDSKNWTFLSITQRIEPSSFKNWTPFFLNMTQRTQPKELDAFWIWLNGLNFFNLIQRIELDSKNWTFFSTWLKELDLFLHDLKNWTLFFDYDSKNWTSFFDYDSKNWTFSGMWLKESIFLKCDKEVNLLFTWLKELNFLECESKNWTLFNMTERIEHCDVIQRIERIFLNVTQRIEPCIVNVTQRIEHVFVECDPKIFFEKYVSRNWTLCFYEYDSKKLNPFKFFDSKNWTLMEKKVWVKEYNLLDMTHRIQPFFWWVKELNLFFECD